MRLTLIISSLSAGGAERVMSLMANYWAAKNWAITLLTYDDGMTPPFYDLEPGISHIHLDVVRVSRNIVSGLLNNIRRLQRVRSAIKNSQPDAVISCLDAVNVITLMATSTLNISTLVLEQCDPRLVSSGRTWQWLQRLTYAKALKVITPCEGVDNYFNWLPQDKRIVIHNPLTPIQDNQEEINLPEGIDKGKNWIVTIGRLTRVKGYDILLSAFQRIANKHPDWQLLIIGNGELRPQLEELRERLHLTHQVFFLGLIKNPFAILKNSKLFVTASRSEGFGNALIEAMACGLPAISTDCPSGPREIIRHGIDGMLVPNGDIEALASTMNYLMINELALKKLAIHASEVTERFDLEKTMMIWEELLDDGLNGIEINAR